MRHRFKLALALFALSMGLLSACAVTALDGAETSLVYVGMDGNHVHALRFDGNTGHLTMLGPVAEVAKPRWALSHPRLPVLYVASDGPTQDGSVIAFAVDSETGALTRINEVAAGGSGTTHLWLDVPSMTLLASNFGGGSVSSIPLNQDGSLGTRVSTLKATGSGPHRRQASPHAHGAAVDPSGRYALVPDLGADRVFVYGFDRASHALRPDDAAPPRSFVAPPGSGPRRAVFGADGRFAYLLNELSADITALRWDPQQGRLAPVQSLPVTSADFQGTKSGSEIAIGPDGRFVYVGNRGENALAVYRVHPGSGELTLVQRTPSGGDMPWNFAVHPNGKWMLVAHYRSNQVRVFRIDPLTGMLSDTGASVDSPSPVSITFMDAHNPR